MLGTAFAVTAGIRTAEKLKEIEEKNKAKKKARRFITDEMRAEGTYIMYSKQIIRDLSDLQGVKLTEDSDDVIELFTLLNESNIDINEYFLKWRNILYDKISLFGKIRTGCGYNLEELKTYNEKVVSKND